jgi:DNA-binding GntR family transcriptional regulator
MASGVEAPPLVERLRADILAAAYSPGERLVELQLAERYGCGRALVRAALLQLETEGLLEREANKGAVVRRVSVAEAIEITEARSVLESLVAAKAARHATDEDVAELEQIIVAMRAAVESRDGVSYGSLNRELHGKVHGIARHAIAQELVANLRNRGVHLQYRLAMMPGRPTRSLEQHAAIVAAIADRDEDAAAEAMRAHLDSVIDLLRQWGEP